MGESQKYQKKVNVGLDSKQSNQDDLIDSRAVILTLLQHKRMKKTVRMSLAVLNTDLRKIDFFKQISFFSVELQVWFITMTSYLDFSNMI